LALLASPAGGGPPLTSYQLPAAHTFPEGIAHDPGTKRFYVGSFADGTISSGKLGTAALSVFLASGGDGRTVAAGLKVDPAHRLYIAGGGKGVVWVYDTSTGALVRKFKTGYSGKQFLNDLAIAPNGDVFVTDTFHPVLYRIPAAAVHQSSTVGTLQSWLTFTGPPLQYGAGNNLNGIAISQDGKYIVVAQVNTASLFRIKRATRTLKKIDLGGQTVAGDGLLLLGRRLYAVERPNVVKIKLAADLLSGTIVSKTTDPSFAGPTTIAVVGTRMLVVNAQFDQIGAGGMPTLPFTVSSIPIP
jgi:DNA-binding beta-propeller fold protein YncE